MAFNSNFKPFYDPGNEKIHRKNVGTNNFTKSSEESSAIQQQRAPARISKYIFFLFLHKAIISFLFLVLDKQIKRFYDEKYDVQIFIMYL